MSTKLDKLSKMIKQFLREFKPWKDIGPARQPDDIRVMTNLEECARSANVLVQDATTIMHSRSSAAGSVAGEEIDRERIQDWIPMEQIHEEQEEDIETLPRYSSMNFVDSRVTFGPGKSDRGRI